MIRELILTSVEKASGSDATLAVPENEEFGDYSSNIALTIYSKFQDSNSKIQNNLKSQSSNLKSSRQVAEYIVNKLRGDKQLVTFIKKIEVAGPGFINFWFSQEALLSELQKVLKQGNKYGSSFIEKGKTVVIDYSSPNIAKHFGIGHLRSTLIGQALYNLYSFLGYSVIGDNHLGDWGTQFGAILAQIQSANLDVKDLDIDKLEELYVEFNKKAKYEPELWDTAREWFKKLEDGDKTARHIWEEVVKISKAEFDRVYELLGVKIDNSYGESKYEDLMPVVIEFIKKKGLIKKSEGAEIVELDNMVPAMIRKSDGTTTYFTRDLATLKFRIDEWKPDLIIYEVGSEQKLHFRQLFEVARLLSWTEGRELAHVAHGLVRLPSGKAGIQSGKLSTRKGQSIKLKDLLNEAIFRASKLTGNSKTGGDLAKSDRQKVSKAVGIGSIKYFDLMHHPASDIIFDWEKMFVLVGNSAPYLQYTYARTQSVIGKAIGNRQQALDSKKLIPSTQSLVPNSEELNLLRAFIHFPEVIEDAAKNYSPNLLCNYLFNLAQKYNAFYNSHRILGSENLKFRLHLTSAAGQILKNGLKILGIDSPQKM